MARYAATIDAAWPADDAFEYLAVFSNASSWDPGVLDAGPLDEGPVRAGSRFRLEVPFLGRRLTLIYQVLEISRADRTIMLEATTALLVARDTITVTGRQPADLPDGAQGRSRVSYRAEVRLRGPARLLDPVLARGFRSVGDRAAAGLADVLNGPRHGSQDPADAGGATVRQTAREGT